MSLLTEIGSIGSRTLNVLTGGDADTSLSARVYIDEWRGLERVINIIALALCRERDHCRRAWDFDVARARAQIARDAARHSTDPERNIQ
jgi:hypothetical protein